MSANFGKCRWPGAARVNAELCRRDLRVFMEQAWPVLEPGTRFVPGFHLDAIAEHLQAVSRGQIHRLLINMPPRHMKSLAVSVFWPTWEWITAPQRRWRGRELKARWRTWRLIWNR